MEPRYENSKIKDMIIAYPLHDALYLNITNRCPNDCVFCIRNSVYGVGYNLWLEQEPDAAGILAAVGDLRGYKELVFCGYGEPLTRPQEVIAVSKAVKAIIQAEQRKFTIRINTNGLADLFLGYDILPQLSGLIDSISISLNAHNSKEYLRLTRSTYGEQAFPAVLEFTRRSIYYIPNVVLTVVRYPGVDITSASEIALRLGVELRVREYQL
jgi:TatD family-associated radical SAM protein